MAHKKGGGSSRNGRDSNAKRRGVKAHDGEQIAAGNIIVRQVGQTIAPGKNVDAVERAIEDNIPAEFQRHAHHWLILHGRYTCVARKPKCNACLIRDLCAFEDKTE